jgi:hypothetical protein
MALGGMGDDAGNFGDGAPGRISPPAAGLIGKATKRRAVTAPC